MLALLDRAAGRPADAARRCGPRVAAGPEPGRDATGIEPTTAGPARDPAGAARDARPRATRARRRRSRVPRGRGTRSLRSRAPCTRWSCAGSSRASASAPTSWPGPLATCGDASRAWPAGIGADPEPAQAALAALDAARGADRAIGRGPRPSRASGRAGRPSRASTGYREAVTGPRAPAPTPGTTAAIAGGLAGVHWGLAPIPAAWRRGLPATGRSSGPGRSAHRDRRDRAGTAGRGGRRPRARCASTISTSTGLDAAGAGTVGITFLPGRAVRRLPHRGALARPRHRRRSPARAGRGRAAPARRGP